MSETRWNIAVLPGGELSVKLAGSMERDSGRLLSLQLVVASDDPSVVQAVEEAARRNGMTISRVEEPE